MGVGVMARRPYLIRAVFLAGFLWLGILARLEEPGWTGLPCLFRMECPAWAAEAPPRKPALELPPTKTPPPASTTRNPMDNLIRLLAGGLLAGVLWSALFGYPFYSYWPDRPGPLGLLDLSVLAAFGYLGFLFLKAAVGRGRKSPPRPPPAFLAGRDSLPLTLTVEPEAEPGLRAIAASDPDFDLAAFGEFAHRLAANLHSAWNRQDLGALRKEVGDDLLKYLDMGLRILNLREEINRLEDLHIHRMAVTAAGQEGDKEFITVGLEGEVVDYVLQKNSYQLVSGSLTYPVALRESWRYERQGGQKAWKLVDIKDH
jgi:predicted lipid-binding transport protein (Tim44 family)